MTSNALKVREKATDEIAEAEWAEAMEEKERLRVNRSAQRLGAIKAAAVIGSHLSSAAFREFERFVEDNDGEAWQALGHKSLVEFLGSDDSPMTKHEYYNRKNAIQREGDAAFDLLNALDISLRRRKLLGEGEIRVEENEVFVGENCIPITDRAQVRSLIATLVESRSTAQETVEKQTRIIEKGKKDVEKWKRKADEATRTGGPSAGSAHGQALITLVGAYANLRDAVIAFNEAAEPGSDEDKEYHEFYRQVVETIGNCYRELSDAFDITEPRADDDLNITDDEAAAMLEDQ